MNIINQQQMVDFSDVLENVVRAQDSSYDVRLQVMPAIHGDVYLVTIENASSFDQYHIDSNTGEWIRVIHD